MNRPEYILLPASSFFMGLTIALAFLLDIMPWGRALWMPDFLALVLVFWSIHQPRRLGLGVAFVMGLLVDVQGAFLLGQTALSYLLLSYFSVIAHRRVLWFPLRIQSLLLLPLFLGVQLLGVIIRLWVGGGFPGWMYFSASFTSVLLWPLVTWLLLAPQRRAINKDETRPI